MVHSPLPPDALPARTFPRAAPQGLAQCLHRDPVLLSAFLVAGGVITYQLVVTLLQPRWIGPVTDWLRAALAWPELLVVLFVSIQLARIHRQEARSWWMLSAGLVSYTMARTLWTIEDQLIFPGYVPFPSLPDLFFVLQYPFFFLAVLLLPSGRLWGFRVKLLLDSVLVMGAATALSWYFLLAPLYLESREALLGKLVTLYYPVGDLVILFGLTITLIYRQSQVTRAASFLLIVAVLCLFIADSWVGWLLLYASFVAGSPPDLFWLIFYLLLPLAGLVALRLTQRMRVLPEAREGERRITLHPQRQDLRAVFRFFFPFVAASLASALIAIRAITDPVRSLSPLAPCLVIFGLLFLVTLRQGIMVLEHAQAQRERAVAHANEQGMREANRQMEAFLGIASHELKTPLSSILLGLQLIQRRAQRPVSNQAGAGDTGGSAFVTSQGALEMTIQQIGRLNRLVNDLVDISRIQSGRLEFKFKTADLAAIVELAVEEQRQAAPERIILWQRPTAGPVLVSGDAERIGQVVSNYLTNALKYSDEAAPVEVGVQVEGAQARVWVRDQGPGIPLDEQARIWERFHRVAGIEVQSGSGIGLGLGLHISKTIIERHQGQVGVESVPGAGATFWFTLPLAVPGEEWTREEIRV